MKKAFTLAESLVTLGIIGIVAALILPAINNTRPDETKIKYLKAYDSLTEMVHAFAANKKEYPVCGPDFIDGTDDNWLNFERYPLLNIEKTMNGSYSNTHNQDKLCSLLAFGYNDNKHECQKFSEMDVNNNANIQPGNNGFWHYSFSSNDGTEWTVRVRKSVSSAAHEPPYGEFGYNVVIDTNGADNQPNCLYDRNNCPHPDRFWFMITADGKVTPADPMGKAYIETRKNPSAKDINASGRSYTQWIDGVSQPNIENQLSTYIPNIPKCE